MAKDPAFLFYPGDWQGGTMYLTHEQKGCYMDLLILQFNVGRFTKAQAKQVLSICFTVAWPMLQQKFKTDGTLFWNERLEIEIEKRKNFTKSRRDNALHTKKTKKHMHEHMEDENINGNENKDFGKSENLLIPSMIKKFLEVNPDYAFDQETDYSSAREIATKILKWKNMGGQIVDQAQGILNRWGEIVNHVKADSHLATYSISRINKHFQSVIQSLTSGTKKTNRYPSKTSGLESLIDSALLQSHESGDRGL